MTKKFCFPTFWTIVLLLGIAWLLREMNVIPIEVDIPWLPAILVVISIGAIVNHYSKQK